MADIDLTVYESLATTEHDIIDKENDFSDFLRGYPFAEITYVSLSVLGLGGGYEQILDMWGDSKKGFQITFPVSTLADALPIRQFYEANYGKRFFFTNPLDSVRYEVRIQDNSYQLQRTAYTTYFARINLVEMF